MWKTVRSGTAMGWLLGWVAIPPPQHPEQNVGFNVWSEPASIRTRDSALPCCFLDK
jgi:hypothetical protein